MKTNQKSIKKIKRLHFQRSAFFFAKFSILYFVISTWNDLIFVHFRFSLSIFSDDIYIAPSGVQKERISPEDLFIQNIEGDDIQVPPEYKK